MTTWPLQDAKNKLSDLLDRVHQPDGRRLNVMNSLKRSLHTCAVAPSDDGNFSCFKAHRLLCQGTTDQRTQMAGSVQLQCWMQDALTIDRNFWNAHFADYIDINADFHGSRTIEWRGVVVADDSNIIDQINHGSFSQRDRDPEARAFFRNCQLFGFHEADEEVLLVVRIVHIDLKSQITALMRHFHSLHSLN
ncbi:MAG: hypothetical protein ACI9R3_005200 [Verrucomicrobiales bacterium]|jgi:hypothetical protein